MQQVGVSSLPWSNATIDQMVLDTSLRYAESSIKIIKLEYVFFLCEIFHNSFWEALPHTTYK